MFPFNFLPLLLLVFILFTHLLLMFREQSLEVDVIERMQFFDFLAQELILCLEIESEVDALEENSIFDELVFYLLNLVYQLDHSALPGSEEM